VDRLKQQVQIHWTLEKLKRFKAAYTKSQDAGETAFMFEGNDFLNTYAKYLIEYLEERLQ
jgi:predicted GTPase